jgi:hypothetical protein
MVHVFQSALQEVLAVPLQPFVGLGSFAQLRKMQCEREEESLDFLDEMQHVRRQLRRRDTGLATSTLENYCSEHHGGPIFELVDLVLCLWSFCSCNMHHILC